MSENGGGDEDGDENGRSQINIRVADEKREKWLEAVNENPEYNTLTHLITLSVDRELSSTSVSSGTTTDHDVMDVLDVIEEFRRDISDLGDDLQADLSDIRLDVSEMRRKERIRNEILETLRNRSDVSGFRSAAELEAEEDSDLKDEQSPAGPMTSLDIAAEIGEEIERVERQLKYLVDNRGYVEAFQLEEGSKTYYIRTDDQQIDSIYEVTGQIDDDTEEDES